MFILIVVSRASGTVYTAIDVATGHEVLGISACRYIKFLRFRYSITVCQLILYTVLIGTSLGRHQANEFITTAEKGINIANVVFVISDESMKNSHVYHFNFRNLLSMKFL